MKRIPQRNKIIQARSPHSHPQLKLFQEILTATYMDVTRVEKIDQKRMMSQPDQMKHRLSKACVLLLRGEIEGEDYRTIKSEAQRKND